MPGQSNTYRQSFAISIARLDARPNNKSRQGVRCGEGWISQGENCTSGSGAGSRGRSSTGANSGVGAGGRITNPEHQFLNQMRQIQGNRLQERAARRQARRSGYESESEPWREMRGWQQQYLQSDMFDDESRAEIQRHLNKAESHLRRGNKIMEEMNRINAPLLRIRQKQHDYHMQMLEADATKKGWTDFHSEPTTGERYGFPPRSYMPLPLEIAAEEDTLKIDKEALKKLTPKLTSLEKKYRSISREIAPEIDRLNRKYSRHVSEHNNIVLGVERTMREVFNETRSEVKKELKRNKNPRGGARLQMNRDSFATLNEIVRSGCNNDYLFGVMGVIAE